MLNSGSHLQNGAKHGLSYSSQMSSEQFHVL